MSSSTQESTMETCKICLGLDRESLRSRSNPFFEFQALVPSALNGCGGCGILQEGIEALYSKLNPTETFRFDYNSMKRFNTGSLIVKGMSESSLAFAPPETSIEFFSLQENFQAEWESYAIGSGKVVPSNLNLQVAASRIMNWLELCQKDHRSCWSSSAASVPTRLLAITQSGSEISIKLIDGSKAVEKYMTLSHCWGDTHPMTTTRESSIERKAGILISDLPETFKHFVLLANALGVEYIWIDSLCIIQDDHDDWAREGGKMALVYAHSYLNIAAAHASGCNDGLFVPEGTSEIDRARNVYELQSEKAKQMKIVARKPTSQAHDAMIRLEKPEQAPAGVQAHRSRAPLLSRAWVYQERSLATRTVFFHASEMVWDCESKMRCECGRLDCVPAPDSCLMYQRPTLINHETGHNYADHWMEVVMAYTKLNLTKESDTLPALSGLAASFQTRLTSGYLAGMWRSDLARSLLWIASEPDLHDKAPPKYGRRPSSYRAPTWSWASFDAYSCFTGTRVPPSITYRDCRPGALKFVLDKDFEILSVGCSLASGNQYGQVNDGLLRVRGLVATPDTCKTDWKAIQNPTQRMVVQNPTTCELGLESVGAIEADWPLERTSTSQGIFTVDFDVIADPDIGALEPTQSNDAELRCLIVANEDNRDIRLLLLKVSHDHDQRKSWERVGTGRVTTWGHGEVIVKRVLHKAKVLELDII